MILTIERDWSDFPLTLVVGIRSSKYRLDSDMTSETALILDAMNKEKILGIQIQTEQLALIFSA